MNVLFVQMPFAAINQPSLALSLLKPTCEMAGFECRIYYPNLKLSAELGHALYSSIAAYQPQTDFLVGEALFSEYIHGTDVRAYFDDLIGANRGKHEQLLDFFSKVADVRSKLSTFIEQTAYEVVRTGADVVGVTSIFQQHAAALALAKAMRKQTSQQFLILGGSNCEGEMGAETAKSFGDYDLVVSGPGETAILAILDVLSGNSKPHAINGVYPTARQEAWPPPTSPLAQETPLDDLPLPDFSDFFEESKSTYFPDELTIQIPFEGSRGCWWGAKHHCTFCGLNGELMRFREKTPARVISELRHMANLHPGAKIVPVDNIMPHSFFQTVLPTLAMQPVGDLFYEVKANLSPPQLHLLKKAGVSEIQPGIESLSDASLRRMRKGVSALQNVRLLKDAKALGLVVYWNILFGFPGETRDEYSEQLEIMKSITHFPPPTSTNMVRVDRFSPLFSHPAEHGILDIRPSKAYSFIYPSITDSARSRLAYYFDADYAEVGSFSDERQAIQLFTAEWRKQYATSFLAKIKVRGKNVLVDTRHRREVAHVLRPIDEAVFDLTSSITAFDAVISALSSGFDCEAAAEAVALWEHRRCLILKGGKLLSVVEDGVDERLLAAAVFLKKEELSKNQSFM